MLFKYCIIDVEFFTLVFSDELCDNSTSNELNCRQTISMPLLNNMRAALKADIDITEMKNVLGAFIHQEIQTGIQTAMKALVEDLVAVNVRKAKQDIIESSIKDEIKEDVNAAFQDKFKQIESTYERKDLNSGDSYDKTTGIFTCLEDGLYTFSWTFTVTPRSPFAIILKVNGQSIAAQAIYTSSVEIEARSCTAVVHMTKGQQAWIESDPGGLFVLDTWNTAHSTIFAGYKL